MDVANARALDVGEHAAVVPAYIRSDNGPDVCLVGDLAARFAGGRFRHDHWLAATVCCFSELDKRFVYLDWPTPAIKRQDSVETVWLAVYFCEFYSATCSPTGEAPVQRAWDRYDRLSVIGAVTLSAGLHQ